ncbi:MAG: tRNA (guanosine(46)-N7)-methyltransferase TrmB [Alphaproteobacteria bacterium]
MRPARQQLVDNLLPTIEIVDPTEDGSFDPSGLFAENTQEIWLEIGFGSGEHLAQQAIDNPAVGFIGCEPYINGVARLLSDIDKHNLTNVRIYRDDARILLRALADASIGRIFILFPDPWPKLRHRKRRIIGPSTIPSLCRLMLDGTELRIATDDPSYKEWILQHMLACEEFEWRARHPRDWRERPADWPATRYEMKANTAGRQCSYFMFDRRR